MQESNKYIQKLCKSLALSLIGVLIYTFSYAEGAEPESYRIKKVVLDAGHGGRDTGALGRKSQEKNIVLNVALKVGAYIEKSFPNVEVLYTRKEDVFVGLDERSNFANEAGADLFISIHCNANPSPVPSGTETYVMGLHKSTDNLHVAQRENGVIAYEDDYSSKYEGYDPNSAESFIIFSLMQNHYLDRSLNMASLIQNEFAERVRRKDRGVKQAGFIVLWKTAMPSVLVELGFLSNPKEEDYLITEDAQTYLASAIYRAFKSYKEEIEQKSLYAAENLFDYSASSSTSTETDYYKEAEMDSGVTFKVQLLVSRNKIPTNDARFKHLKDVEMLGVDGIYKYVLGNKMRYNDIAPVCEQAKEVFPDAFIIAFHNGKQIPLEQAKKLSQ